MQRHVGKINPNRASTAGAYVSLLQAIAFLLAGKEVDTPSGMQRKAHPEHVPLRLLQFLAAANLERQQKLWLCSLQTQAKSSDSKLARQALSQKHTAQTIRCLRCSKVLHLQAFLRIGGPLAEVHIPDLARRLQDLKCLPSVLERRSFAPPYTYRANCVKEHDVRVYRSVIDTLGNLGVAAAQHVSLIRARLEAHASGSDQGGPSVTEVPCMHHHL